MRSLSFSKSGLTKVRSYQFELKASDFEESLKSMIPGEWFFVKAGSEFWTGYANPNIQEKYACAQILEKVAPDELDVFTPEKYIVAKIQKAYSKRSVWEGYGNNARIFYGASDGLPGLIIDNFENASIVQINTAGIDRFRELIKDCVNRLTSTPVHFLDNPKYREKEALPVYPNEQLPELRVNENGLKYLIRPEVLQKIGFYYDHRENRLQLMNVINRLKNKPRNGLDLFSYAGAWGMSALQAGVEAVTFVDQGEFGPEVMTALETNGFGNRGKFLRSDVFKYLDQAQAAGELFDLILCDPPAFAKSVLQKSQALEGYSKLHRKVFKALTTGSVVAFSSCTHYVSHDEFQKNILEASYKENRRIQLVYSGIQGLDHPISSLSDRANYIKSYFYIVE
ncbi:MAG: class I SAM-dependent rRNA methyltransferase [Bacteriovoracia bacterium]